MKEQFSAVKPGMQSSEVRQMSAKSVTLAEVSSTKTESNVAGKLMRCASRTDAVFSVTKTVMSTDRVTKSTVEDIKSNLASESGKNVLGESSAGSRLANDQQNPKANSTKKAKGAEPACSDERVFGSVMKTDLGEILRRSCRERKMNTRFTEDSITSCLPLSDGIERKGRNSAFRIKDKQQTYPTAIKHTGDKTQKSTRNSSDVSFQTRPSSEQCHELKITLINEKTMAKKQSTTENPEEVKTNTGNGRRGGDTSTSSDQSSKIIPEKKFTNPFRACMLKRNRKRFFKGTTYSLNPRRTQKKKRKIIPISNTIKDGHASCTEKLVDNATVTNSSAAAEVIAEVVEFTSTLTDATAVEDLDRTKDAEENVGNLQSGVTQVPAKLLENVGAGDVNFQDLSARRCTDSATTSCFLVGKDAASANDTTLVKKETELRESPSRETHKRTSTGDGESGTAAKYRRKNSDIENTAAAKTPSDSKRMQMVTLYPPTYVLCTCRSLDGIHTSSHLTGHLCQGIDCIDSKLIGCVNSVRACQEVLRPAARIPFQVLCEVHRQRLRLHQCCPGCGLFCTQGNFVQCRADPKKGIHHCHKECMLRADGKESCPHCGDGKCIQEVYLQLNAPRPPAVYKHQQVKRKEPGARMAFTKLSDLSKTDTLNSLHSSCSIQVESGKEISTAGLPDGPDRSHLEEILSNITKEHSSTLRCNVKNILAALKNGDVEKVLQLLSLGFDANMKFGDHDNCSPLHVAAAHGHVLVTHVLVQANAFLDSVDCSMQTPLMFAIESGHVNVSQYLIKAGAQLDAKGDDGMTALHLAAKAGQLEICKLILNAGKICVNVLDDGGWTPLVWAAEHNHLPVVKFLLDSGSDPNIRDNELNVALHWSCFAGSVAVSELLLNNGCDLNTANEHRDTPLHIAARQNNYDCVMLLLAGNADVDAENKEGETPLMACADPNSQTFLALSMSKHLKEIAVSRIGKTEKILYQDISRGKEQNPIQCINGVDDEPAPSDFLYIKENCETSPINVERSITSLQSCNCDDDDDCSSPNCTCGSMSFKCWYDSEGRLIDEFNLFDPPMVFECNSVCRCWATCRNRVLQRGMTSRLQLFRTIGKGWGVRTLRDIPKGTLVCEYIGEVISDLEADQRDDDSYLFDLDNQDGETYCIDARRYGNVSRFINHLCEPNLVPVKVFVDYQDLRFPRIAFFSSRPIQAFEELGFDYGDKFWIIKYKMFTCQCLSPKCKYSSETIHKTLASCSQTTTADESDEDVVSS